MSNHTRPARKETWQIFLQYPEDMDMDHPPHAQRGGFGFWHISPTTGEREGVGGMSISPEYSGPVEYALGWMILKALAKGDDITVTWDDDIQPWMKDRVLEPIRAHQPSLEEKLR